MSPATIAKVERLLHCGMSQLVIARRLGLTWTAVYRIAAGLEGAAENSALEAPPPVLGDPARARRCGGCGALIYLWPCLHCANRSAAAAGPA